MAKSNVGNELAKLISRLRAERGELVQKLQEIDQLCDQLGISKEALAQAPIIRERKARAPKADKPAGRGRRKRGSFEKTGEQSVIDFVTANGPSTSAEINVHWTNEGRGGRADNTITKLVQSNKLKRLDPVPGERGGKVTVA